MDGKPISNPQIIANAFNGYFLSLVGNKYVVFNNSDNNNNNNNNNNGNDDCGNRNNSVMGTPFVECF
jgi:hypothetical protein